MLVSVALLLSGLGQDNRAEAGVVTFDDAAGNSVLFTQFNAGQSFSNGGLTFTNLSGDFMFVWDGSSPNSNGTNNNIFAGFTPGGIEEITKTGGGAFNLKSIDLAISWYDPNATEVITVNGIPLTITQTLTTYNLNLTGVTKVDISGLPSGTGYWLADNLVFADATVPEPATLIAFGVMALGGAGYVRRRKVAATA